ncbi:hypothetical protein ANCCEY_06246 [Ancylostoma ceylanicum]|uniref:Uncharacterized protein n=1 Tax=Ancylostoma ceylanicum TaxID=53326 RepID=A0A0D6LTY9_9BILA|nr:hypothetical protein ANCCEY_06246 [Ancylostoma ceylanicum]
MSRDETPLPSPPPSPIPESFASRAASKRFAFPFFQEVTTNSQLSLQLTPRHLEGNNSAGLAIRCRIRGQQTHFLMIL